MTEKNFNSASISDFIKACQNSKNHVVALSQNQKSNAIDIFKKGNKIHIKKENRGKFTDYCGGKVTSECISRGKNSSDPKIRKRATFADNARHFKHKLGGQIVWQPKAQQLVYGNLFKFLS